MPLFTRFAKLITADLHSLLDCLEEPEVLLQQSIREMREVLVQEQQQLQTYSWKLRQVEQGQQTLLKQIPEMDSQIALCFQNSRDDLAKKFVLKKLEMEQALHHLNHHLDQ